MGNENKRIALVTGASRGIGRAIALALSQQGMIVLGTATSEAGAASITEYFKSQHTDGVGLVLDVCDADAVKSTVERIGAEWGPITVLVNNAGITRDNLLLRMSPDQWDDVIETNLTAVYRLTKSVLRMMLKARYGRIVNISSVVGVMGNPGQVNYVAAKAGLIGFSKSLAREMVGAGITVNVVAPGFIQTDMVRDISPEHTEALLAMIPMKRMGTPEDIAYAVSFLVSEQASYITGQTLHINGGMCMV